MSVVYAQTTIWTSTRDGVPVFVPEGSHWDSEDPLVKDHPSLFSDDPSVGMHTSEYKTPGAAIFVGPQPEPEPERAETTTATPGEQRRTKRP